MTERGLLNLDKITVKGFRRGLLVTLTEGFWDEGVRALEAHLGENPAFFQGGRVALDVGSEALSRSEIEEVRTLLARHQVELWAVLSDNPATESAARALGLVVDLEPPRTSETEASVKEERPSPEGIVVRGTLRSGQSLRHPGHIVVIGDINPGAEVVAGGNIVIWGRARGLVHAGALGDEGAVICALDLKPTQLRIAGHIARSPEESRSESMPEMASVRDEQIVAVPWYGSE